MEKPCRNWTQKEKRVAEERQGSADMTWFPRQSKKKLEKIPDSHKTPSPAAKI